MIWRVEVKPKDDLDDSVGKGVLADIADLNIANLNAVRAVCVYLLEGNLSRGEIESITRQLLVDPIVEEYRIYEAFHRAPAPPDCRVVEIAYNPGVMDPTEASTLKGIRDLGFTAANVHTARQYYLYGKLSDKQLAIITERVLMNKLIQHAVNAAQPAVRLAAGAGPVDGPPQFQILLVNVLRATDKELMEFSRSGGLYLNLAEMRAVKAYFKKEGRNPTDVELETIAQTWSEHCRHKTFRGNIRYRDAKTGKPKLIRNLFKSTIAKATDEINKKWCVSVFHDNAGVIAFDDEYHVCFKVETHNHPSALEPFGGANTGMGGVIRDILGTGLGAKPICSTDVFCFAPPDMAFKDVPDGVLHPKRVMKGVVAGVRDYGNKMGIPTVNGAIAFDPQFVANPLVFCGNVGLLPKGKEKKKVRKGDLIVALGGRTGRDGIHGATFSSGELTSASETVSSGAVQIGNPIEEKKVLDALMKARDEDLYTAITDCGAGGFSSAVGEMAAETGARVDLEKAPLKYQGLKYHEIWISESQERMVLSVPKKNFARLANICADENVEAVAIGEFAGGRLQLFFHGAQVGDLDLHFLHHGVPLNTKEAVYTAPALRKAKLPGPWTGRNLTAALSAALSNPNVASKESIIRVYDHEVQGGSVIKPLVGEHADGPSDAAVVRPVLGSNKGIAIANGINHRFGRIDPFWMAAAGVDEAIRQIIAVGGHVGRIALLDNFCWGNPDKPDRLGSLVRCALGCYKAAVAFGTPFISGKDSLYNEYTHKGKSLAIPGTILISSLGIIDDVRRSVSMDFKEAQNSIFILGTTYEEMGGSIYLENLGLPGGEVPKVYFKKALKMYNAVSGAVQAGLVDSLHDCSEGGLGVALAEMAFAGGFGVKAWLGEVPYQGTRRDDNIMFSESSSRLIAEVSPKNVRKFLTLLRGIPLGCIGTVEQSREFVLYGLNRKPLVEASIAQLKEDWQRPLRI